MSKQGRDWAKTQPKEKPASDAFAAIRWARRQRQIPHKVAKVVLLVLATYADPDGTGAWPSQEELAADTGFSARAIRGALAWLAEQKYLERVERRRRNGSRRSDEYILKLDRRDDNRNEVPVLAAEATGTAGHTKRNPTTEQPAPDSGPTTFDQPRDLPKDDSSEPFGSGPGQPAPGRKQVFSEGRTTLVGLGVSRKTAGDVINRWLRDTEGDAPRVLAAIRTAGAAAAISPIPFVNACLKPRNNHARPTDLSELDQALAGNLEWLRALEGAQSCHP